MKQENNISPCNENDGDLTMEQFNYLKGLDYIKPENIENNAEGKVIKYFIRNSSQKVRDAASIVNIFPARNMVIIKATFLHSYGLVINKKEMERSSPEKLEVVGYGNETYSVEIGDMVTIGYNASIEKIKLPGNNRTIDNVSKEIMSYNKKTDFNKLLNTKIEIHEYFIVPEFSINGYVNDSNIKSSLSLHDAVICNV